jgi:hypothetical protein
MMVDSLLPGEEFTRGPSAMALRKLLRIKSVDRNSPLYISRIFLRLLLVLATSVYFWPDSGSRGKHLLLT